jgi:hypothetical protein
MSVARVVITIYLALGATPTSEKCTEPIAAFLTEPDARRAAKGKGFREDHDGEVKPIKVYYSYARYTLEKEQSKKQ